MKTIRCAIYTRKSSEEGLEQGFNSLDAQREACAAYILSQASEGWTALPDVYDDGGISGGTLERPALQRLLTDIAARRIDIIVVYKVDRLTRSLLDFSKLVEAFDKASVSFVSITQSFNTTTSMGRLTLNMLLSFAQFEREVTAERIRDKIAASKAKGMWMGGTPPLGYEPAGRSLKVVAPHAAIVRDIFRRYIALGNVRPVADQLAAEGIGSPVRIKAKTGQQFGGLPFSRGQIYNILKCPTYFGKVHHNGQVYVGLHDALIDRDTWDRTQALLASNLQGHRSGDRATQASLLAGKLVDEMGQPLIATHACKGRGRYRYYVTRALHHEGATRGMRIPAPELEKAVASRLASALADPLALIANACLTIDPSAIGLLMERAAAAAAAVQRCNRTLMSELIEEVRIQPSAIEIRCDAAAIAALLDAKLHPGAPSSLALVAELRLTRTGHVMRLIQRSGAAAAPTVDPAMLRQIIRARSWWQELRSGILDVTTLAAREGVQSSYVTRVLRLAFLSPTVIDAILAGRQRAGLGVATLVQPGRNSGRLAHPGCDNAAGQRHRQAGMPIASLLATFVHGHDA